MHSALKVCAVVGVGPGLGASVAKRFSKGGYAVALLSRSEDSLKPVQKNITDSGGKAISVLCDAGSEDSVKNAFKQIRDQLGDPEVLIYNAGAFKRGAVKDLSPDDFHNVWKVGCLGGLLTAQQVLPAMEKHGRGTVLYTGATASLRGSAMFAAFATSKFGLRALAQSLARESGPKGIHVAHVIIDGQILIAGKKDPARDESTYLNPDSIAETYWQLHLQDKTAWTWELELRPSVEKW